MPELRGHRLGDLAPHFLPEAVRYATPSETAPAEADRVDYFVCHFDPSRGLSWQVEGAAAVARHEDVQLAIDAWRGALPELAWNAAAPLTKPQLTIRIEGEETTLRGTGSAQADCQPASGRRAARLVRATVRVRHLQADALGRVRPLAREEFVGALAHEIGHALGFASHAGSRDDLMSLTVDASRWAGRRVLEGRALDARSVVALYRVPSGTPVGQGRLTPRAATQAARLASLALRHRWDGPFTRVGDRSGELYWRTAAGERPALWAPRPDARWPEPMVFLPNRDARRWLAGKAETGEAPSAERGVEGSRAQQ